MFIKLSILEDVAFASNGEEALAYLESNQLPEHIFLDQNMPVLNGSEFLQTLIDNNTDLSPTKIYVMTGGEIPPEFTKEPFSKLVQEFIERPLKLSVFSKLLTV